MSRSSPGRYALHEYAKNVFELAAFDGKGKELPISRPNPYQWNVTGHDGSVRVVYKIYGDHVDGTYLAIDPTHAHMNMPATLLWARGLDARPRAGDVRPAEGLEMDSGDAAVRDRRSLDVHRAEPSVPDGQPGGAQRPDDPQLHGQEP